MDLELRHLPADVLGLSDLARATLAGRPRPAALGGLVVPARLDHIDPRTAADEPAFLDRAELPELLAADRTARGPGEDWHPAQARNLERLARPDAQVVLCGQQPGLLGGPLLNLYKAVHTVRLARALEDRWGSPVVPLFWCHSDDHDLAEVGRTHVLNRHLDIARVGLSGMGPGRMPLGELRMERERYRLSPLFEALRQLLTDNERRDPLLTTAFPRDGETLATAFVRFWDHMLGHTGLITFEPRALRTPLSRALAHVVSTDVDGALRDGLERLERCGCPADLHAERVPWAFHHRPEGRAAVRFVDGAFRFDDEPGGRTGAELAARLVSEPDDWSPGVLTRPLVQDLCLPVAAYIGGWGELSYHAPLLEIRRATDTPITPFCNRFGATLVSPASRYALNRLELDEATVLRAAGELGPPKKDRPKHPVVEQIRVVNREATRSIMDLQGPLAELDRGLSRQLKRSAKQAAELIERIARKAERVQANRSGKSNRHYRRLNNCLFGRQTPQERSLTALQYIVAFGTDWIDSLVDSIEPLPTEHLVVEFIEPPVADQ